MVSFQFTMFTPYFYFLLKDQTLPPFKKNVSPPKKRTSKKSCQTMIPHHQAMCSIHGEITYKNNTLFF